MLAIDYSARIDAPARVAALDLLRGVAAGGVAVFHFLMSAKIGGGVPEAVSIVAVEVFFVLSGYVLAPQILMVLKGGARPLGTFLVRRWMRTIPAYLVALVLLAALFNMVFTAEFARYAFYVENLFGQSNQRDFFSTAWSLAVEEWFYLVFPLVLLCARRRPVLIAVAFIVAVSVAREVWGDYSSWGAMVRRVVAFRIDSIAYGFLLYVVVTSRMSIGPVMSAALFTVSSVAMALDLSVMDGSHQRLAQSAFPFVAAAFGSSAILLANALEPACRRLAGLSRISGQWSYGVYLYHLIALFIVEALLGGQPVIVRLAAFIGLTLALAASSWTMLEEPILARRPWYH